MKRLFAIAAFLTSLIFPASAGTSVWNLTGWGPQFWSPGIYTIANAEKSIPGVNYIRVYPWYATQQVANEMMTRPAGDKLIVVGYSCGANSATVIAKGLEGHRPVYPIGIQESLWCGGYALGSNVPAAQETYAGCIITLGFGCKQYAAGPGFRGHIVLIKRPDLHPLADTDQDAQRDVLSAVATIANPAAKHRYALRLSQQPRVKVITRYHGQQP